MSIISSSKKNIRKINNFSSIYNHAYTKLFNSPAAFIQAFIITQEIEKI